MKTRNLFLVVGVVALLMLTLAPASAQTPATAAAAQQGGGGRGGRGGATAKSEDEKPFFRAELHALTAQITAAIAKATDHDTKAHLEGAKDQIAKILDPKFLAPANEGGGGGRGGRGGAR